MQKRNVFWLAGLAMFTVSMNLQALPKNPYYIVADDYIAPDMVEEHEQALREFKVQVDKTGYRGSWHFYQFDAGFLTENSAVYNKSIVDQDFFML